MFPSGRPREHLTGPTKLFLLDPLHCATFPLPIPQENGCSERICLLQYKGLLRLHFLA